MKKANNLINIINNNKLYYCFYTYNENYLIYFIEVF